MGQKENEKLKKERGISFEEIEMMILERKYIAIVKHPKHPYQRIFLIPVHGYIHAVPFIIDNDGNIVLKTIFPSRAFNKKYGKK